MSQSQSLRMSRTFPVPRERVFRAWTDPSELKKWWLLGHGWRLNVVEVDLRVGGSYRIGLESTEKKDIVHEVNGIFRQVETPDKLVYTWKAKDPNGLDEESLVTVEFREKGSSSTELVLTHDRLENRASRQTTYDGWLMVLDGLVRLLGS